MPITIKQNIFKYKNPTTGQYQSVDAVAETTTSEQIAAIQEAGANVLDEIPASYTDLSSNLITMQETQPTNEYNKMWIKNGTSYQVPTMDDFNSAITKNNLSNTLFATNSGSRVANANDAPYGQSSYDPNTANIPSGGSSYGIIQHYYAMGWNIQIAYDTYGNVYKRRNINSGGWTAWVSIPPVPRYITIQTSSSLVVSVDALLCGDILFVSMRMSKDIPSPAFQNISFSLENTGRSVKTDAGSVGRSGSVSFGSGSDTGKIACARLYPTNSGCGMSVSVSQALNADFFVSFCVPYY